MIEQIPQLSGETSVRALPERPGNTRHLTINPAAKYINPNFC
jgi:hypothetical protein